MRKALEVLNRERIAEGKTAFAHGIGVHSGSVLAGNSGSEEQSAYCLIGNTVNVAARIQGLTRIVGCDILISEETVKQLSISPEMEPLPPRHVKGYSKPISIEGLISAVTIPCLRCRLTRFIRSAGGGWTVILPG